MKKSKFKNIYALFFLLFFISSCTSNLDFDQANDLKTTPVIVANVAYFDVPANEFVTNGIENRVSIDGRNFDVFRDAFLRDNLTQADFLFEITNTINRSFTVNLYLINEFDQILYTIIINVPASTTGAPVVVTTTEVFKDAKLNLLKQTDKMGFILLMNSGTTITESTPGDLKFKSSATVYLEVQ